MKIPKRLQGGTEQSVVKPKVRKLLDTHGWFWWATPASIYSRSGIADLIAVKQGMLLAVETKFKRNDPTPLQVAFLNSLRAESHFAFVVRETTIDAFKDFLTYLDKSVEIAGTGAVPGSDIGGPMMDAINTLMSTEIMYDKARMGPARSDARPGDSGL